MSEAVEPRESGTRRFKPYPEYKASGVEWVGEIPAHWEVKKWRYCCHVTEGQVAPDDDRYRDRIMIAPDHIESGTGRILFTETADQQGAISGKYLVKPGDLIYSKIRPALNKVCIAAGDWLCSADMYPVKVTASDLRPRYLLYFILSEPFVRLMVDESMRVAMPKVNREKLASCPLLIPAPSEQGAIAAFLDRETGKIDALVAKKERLIELLQEKRTTLITRAVTKGLDPNVPMKDSGVEWLGEIPAHWETVPIRSLVRPGFKTFTDGDWIESPFIREEGVRLIQTGNVGVGEYREQGFRYIDEETFRTFRCTEVLAGDVLICRLADPVGRACLAPDLGRRMITSVDVCILKTSPTVDAGYVVFALSGSSYLSWMSGICRGGTRDRVSRSMLGSIRVQKPPYEEQCAIAAFLDRETAKVDALVAKVSDAIDRLKELRTALISAAVTGKIDVRGGAEE